jgi:Family of unknown function (DUF6232)
MSKAKDEGETLDVARNTLQLGNSVYQLDRIYKIEKSAIKEERKKTNNFIPFCLAGLGIALIFQYQLGWTVVLVGGILLFLALSKLSQKVPEPKTRYGIVVTTDISTTLLFSHPDEKLVDEIITQIAKSMDNPNQRHEYRFSLKEGSIINQTTYFDE